MPDQETRQITGDDIIAELLRNCEHSQFPIRRSVLLPSLFYVYLHPADYEVILPVLKPLTAEAKAALAEKLDEANRKATPGAVARLLGSEKKIEYRIADADWSIEFFPDSEDKLERGEVEVHSELASAARPELEGAITRHVTRRLSAPSEATTAPASARVNSGPSESPIFGKLRYQEDGNAREFSITRPQIVIGRGSKTHWVDLKLEAPPDVSREHCRIRWDERTGRFYLSDTSQYGTALDGAPLPPGGTEVELPKRALIALAGVITLEFEAL